MNTENKYPVVNKGDLFLDVGIAKDMLSSIYDDKHELSSENNKQPLIELGKNVKLDEQIINVLKDREEKAALHLTIQKGNIEIINLILSNSKLGIIKKTFFCTKKKTSKRFCFFVFFWCIVDDEIQFNLWI